MRKHTKSFTIVTSKMPTETEQQYTAFLLYSEVFSINKLIEAWRSPVGTVSAILRDSLGKIPSKRTLERWSTQFSWVQRADMKLSEDLEVLKKKTSQIRQKRLYYLTDVFWEKLQTLQAQMKKGERATVQELKSLWEMMRIENGEPINKEEIVKGIDESEQKPPTPEEEELGKAIDNAIKEFYDNQAKKKYQKT